MSDWQTAKVKEEHQVFCTKLVALSQMVDDGKLNSTGAREVFRELYEAYRRNLAYIRQIDELIPA